MQRGEFPPVPILAGSVAEEGWLFVIELFPKVVSKIEYDGLIRVLFGKEDHKDVLRLYPFDMINGEAETDGRNALSRLGTDLLMYCSLKNATRSFQSAQGAAAKQVFHYEHRQIIAEDIWEPSNPYCVGHDCHGSDLPFIFNAWGDNKDHVYEITDDEKQLSVDMSHAWANFIAHADPNVGLQVPVSGFPTYSAQADAFAAMQEPGFSVDSKYKVEYCQLWDRIGYYW
jgi:carboxylesterase type B